MPRGCKLSVFVANVQDYLKRKKLVGTIFSLEQETGMHGTELVDVSLEKC